MNKNDKHYTATNKTPEWREGLRRHLIKAEIEYVADNGGGIVPTLRGFADEYALKKYLRGLGFRVERKTTEVDGYRYIRTSKGISIDAETGFCVRAN